MRRSECARLRECTRGAGIAADVGPLVERQVARDGQQRAGLYRVDDALAGACALLVAAAFGAERKSATTPRRARNVCAFCAM